MPQCLPSCDERSLGSRTPRLANPKPRRCLHGTQRISVWTQMCYVTRKLAKQRPQAFHCTREPIVRRQLWEERTKGIFQKRHFRIVTTFSWSRVHGSHRCVCPPTCVVCVCVYIYIYIVNAFYLLLKYCTDGPMVIVNYGKMKLILNKGSRVPDSKRYVFTQCTNTTGSTPFNFTLCIQCAEYIDRKREYKGMMTTHQNNHLHIFEISPARVYTT